MRVVEERTGWQQRRIRGRLEQVHDHVTPRGHVEPVALGRRDRPRRIGGGAVVDLPVEPAQLDRDDALDRLLQIQLVFRGSHEERPDRIG